jgi:hypothetical protein
MSAALVGGPLSSAPSVAQGSLAALAAAATAAAAAATAASLMGPQQAGLVTGLSAAHLDELFNALDAEEPREMTQYGKLFEDDTGGRAAGEHGRSGACREGRSGAA